MASRTQSECAARSPTCAAARRPSTRRSACPGGESPRSATRRTGCVVDEIGARLKAVAATHGHPFTRPDAALIHRSGWRADRPVVLRAAVDVVERHRIVHGDTVELRGRYLKVTPSDAAIIGFVQPAVVARPDMERIGRIEADVVVVHMDRPIHGRECLAAVGRADVGDGKRTDAIEMEWIGIDLAVVLWVVRVPAAL